MTESEMVEAIASIATLNGHAIQKVYPRRLGNWWLLSCKVCRYHFILKNPNGFNIVADYGITDRVMQSCGDHRALSCWDRSLVGLLNLNFVDYQAPFVFVDLPNEQ